MTAAQVGDPYTSLPVARHTEAITTRPRAFSRGGLHTPWGWPPGAWSRGECPLTRHTDDPSAGPLGAFKVRSRTYRQHVDPSSCKSWAARHLRYNYDYCDGAGHRREFDNPRGPLEWRGCVAPTWTRSQSPELGQHVRGSRLAAPGRDHRADATGDGRTHPYRDGGLPRADPPSD